MIELKIDDVHIDKTNHERDDELLGESREIFEVINAIQEHSKGDEKGDEHRIMKDGDESQIFYLVH